MNGRVNLTDGLAADFHQSNSNLLESSWRVWGPVLFLNGEQLHPRHCNVFIYHVSFLRQSPTFRGSRQCLKGNGEPKTSLFVYTQPKRRAVSAFVVIYLYSRIQHLGNQQSLEVTEPRLMLRKQADHSGATGIRVGWIFLEVYVFIMWLYFAIVYNGNY